jgi:hypothetical protein
MAPDKEVVDNGGAAQVEETTALAKLLPELEQIEACVACRELRSLLASIDLTRVRRPACVCLQYANAFNVLE